MDTPDKQCEGYIQLRIKLDVYETKYSGKQMPDGQVLVGGRVIHDYKQRLQAAVDALPINAEYTNKDKKTEAITATQTKIDKEAIRGNRCPVQTATRQTLIARRPFDYDSPDSSRRDRDSNIPNVMQLGPGGQGEPPDGDDDEPGSPGDPGSGNHNDLGMSGHGGKDKSGREFQFVNPRNVIVTQLVGKQLNTNPYMPVNNAVRNVTLTQGQDGEELLEVLDIVESFGDEKFSNKYIGNVFKQRPKVYENS